MRIALFANESTVREHLAEATEVFIPCIAIAELNYGARKSSRVQANLARIDAFVASTGVLGCDATPARWYGEIKYSLRLKGCPLPENDSWIAAIAGQPDLRLVSRDAHFQEIESV
ncbi:type II toxin-antitoxin system VapC family toxin [Leptolyngbya sp. NK1-12]|uniref:type II toxin-antitoxin system VapC family toxin n=1 Tax=Leptolyngbya sp. NK1-12 TaxID=2547451 RepID=UPI0029304F0C|nr:type II toxin-antitoxin system VapC family toxin [Leptolyngbya sp. NK1-12]